MGDNFSEEQVMSIDCDGRPDLMDWGGDEDIRTSNTIIQGRLIWNIRYEHIFDTGREMLESRNGQMDKKEERGECA